MFNSHQSHPSVVVATDRP